MANFVQNNSSPFAKINLYQPDWSFLTTVMGTRQAEYDRGFNAVREYNKSILASPLTNGENIAFRQEGFKKLERSLRSVANLDLSDPSNISKATGILDPLANDEDLAYDRYVTSFHNDEKQRMEAYKNSTDPEVRKQYSEFAEARIQFAEDDLRKAKRGDGSIRQVQPKEFVPFDDVMGYLNKAATDQKLEISYSVPKGGYIITYKNGAELDENGKPRVAPIFTNWAYTQMGTRFDRQFAVMGEVQAESAIRNEMMTKGVDRQTAINLVSQSVLPTLKTAEVTKLKSASSEYNDIDLRIKKFEEVHVKDGQFDTVEHAEEYKRMLDEKDSFQSQTDNSVSEITKLENDGTKYVASNLYTLLGNNAKQQTAYSWGASTASATQGMSIAADEKYLTELREANANQRHLDDLRYKYEALGVEKQKLATAQQIAISENKLPSATVIGNVAPSQEISAGSVAIEAGNKSYDEMFNYAFASVTAKIPGMVNMILTPKEYQKYIPSLNNLNNVAQGNIALKMRPGDFLHIMEYANRIGYELTKGDMPKSQAEARALMENISLATYDKASKMRAYNKTENVSASTASFERAFGLFATAVEDRETFMKNMDEVAQYIEAHPESFGNVPKIGITNTGRAIYDITALPLAQQQLLDPIISPTYGKQTRPVGQLIQQGGQNAATYGALILNAKNLAVNGFEGDESLMGMNPVELQELTNKTISVGYDPSSKLATVEIRTKQDKNEKVRSLKFQVPFETLMHTKGLEHLAQQAVANTPSPTTGGLFTQFMTNPYASVSAPTYQTSTGFDWTATGVNDYGQYGLLLNFNINGEQISYNLDNIDPSDPASWNYANSVVNQIYYDYLGQKQALETANQ